MNHTVAISGWQVHLVQHGDANQVAILLPFTNSADAVNFGNAMLKSPWVEASNVRILFNGKEVMWTPGAPPN